MQHRMQENAAELWRWLDAGAYFYVCGDALKMAKDVDAALRGDCAGAEAASRRRKHRPTLSRMKVEKRYKRDVY